MTGAFLFFSVVLSLFSFLFFFTCNYFTQWFVRYAVSGSVDGRQ